MTDIFQMKFGNHHGIKRFQVQLLLCTMIIIAHMFGVAVK